jgi:hypothetical protein
MSARATGVAYASVWILGAAVTGCSLFGGDPVRHDWENRSSLQSCGEVDLKLGERLKQEAKSELSCLRAARDSDEGAELKVQFRTIEGDPVTYYYRVIPGGTTELYVDSTKDPNSGEEWGYSACPDPQSVLDVNC